MPVVESLLDSAGVVLLVLLFLGLYLVVRRRVLARHGGTFELAVRRPDAPLGRGWSLGMGRYREDSLEWFRVFSPVPAPARSWRRDELVFESQRPRVGPEQLSLYDGHVVVICRLPVGHVELAMSPSSLTGLQSWLEAAPPDWRRTR